MDFVMIRRRTLFFLLVITLPFFASGQKFPFRNARKIPKSVIPPSRIKLPSREPAFKPYKFDLKTVQPTLDLNVKSVDFDFYSKPKNDYLKRILFDESTINQSNNRTAIAINKEYKSLEQDLSTYHELGDYLGMESNRPVRNQLSLMLDYDKSTQSKLQESEPAWLYFNRDPKLVSLYRLSKETGLKGIELKTRLKEEIVQRQQLKEKYEGILSLFVEGPEQLGAFQKDLGLEVSRKLDETSRSVLDMAANMVKTNAEKYADLSFRLGHSSENLTLTDFSKPENLKKLFADYLKAGDGFFDKAVFGQINKRVENLQQEFTLLKTDLELLEFASCQDFQAKHQLQTNGIFDNATRTELNRQKELAEHSLTSIGVLPGDMKSRLTFYNQFGRNQGLDLVESLRADETAKVWISPAGEKLLRTEFSTETANGQSTLINTVRYKDLDVYIKLDEKNPHNLDLQLQRVRSQLNHSFEVEEIQILSLVKDQATNRMIKDLFGDNQIKFPIKQSGNLNRLEKKLSKSKRKTVFVVGHIEEGYFVSRKKGEEIFRISLKELEEMGRRLNINLFPFGCNSSSHYANQTGTTRLINSYADTKKLIEAIKSSNKLEQVLQKFTGPDTRIIIDENTFKNMGYAEVKYLKQAAKETAVEFVVGGALILAQLAAGGEDDDETER